MSCVAARLLLLRYAEAFRMLKGDSMVFTETVLELVPRSAFALG